MCGDAYWYDWGGSNPKRLRSSVSPTGRSSGRGEFEDDSVTTFEAGEIRLEIALVETGSFSVGFPESAQVRALNGFDFRRPNQSTGRASAIDQSQCPRCYSTRESATQLHRFVARQDLLGVNGADAEQDVPRRAPLLRPKNSRKGHLPIGFGVDRHIGSSKAHRLPSSSLTVSPSRNFTSILSKPPSESTYSVKVERRMSARRSRWDSADCPIPIASASWTCEMPRCRRRFSSCGPIAANGVSFGLRRLDFMIAASLDAILVATPMTRKSYLPEAASHMIGSVDCMAVPMARKTANEARRLRSDASAMRAKSKDA